MRIPFFVPTSHHKPSPKSLSALRAALSIWLKQRVQRQFKHAAWHADLPAFEDFGMELADEADGLIADENLRDTAFKK